MRFVAQFFHSNRLDLGEDGRGLYLFECQDTCDSRSAASGANAALLLARSAQAAAMTKRQGAAKPEEIVVRWSDDDDGVPEELAATFMSPALYAKLDPEVLEECYLMGNRAGGVPGWLNGVELPEGDGWRFLLQLDSSALAATSFGGSGIAHVFIDLTQSRAAWSWER